MHDFLPFIVIGLATGAVYGLAGLGLVLTYKTSGIFNFGYGAVAALVAMAFYEFDIVRGWPWPVAALLSLGIVAPAIGILLELLGRALDGATETLKVVATVGLILIVQSLASFWHATNPPPSPHFLPQGTVKMLGVYISWEQIILFLFSAFASAVLWWFFRSARLGIVMRGLVDSHELVSMSGDSPVRVRRSAWIIGTVFAGFAGLFLAPDQPLDGISLTILVFAAFGSAAIGYFSNLWLTFAGGLFIGVAGALVSKYGTTISWATGIPPSLPFIVLFLVLIVAPRRKLVQRRVPAQMKVRAPYYAPTRIRLTGGGIVILLLALVPVIQAGHIALWSAAMVDIIMFLSLGLLVRRSGQISLCHVAFMAVGAAGLGHFTNMGVPWFLAVILSALVAVPVGALIAVPAIRVSGVFLALATLGFGLVAQEVFYTRGFMFGALQTGLAEPRPSFSIGGWDMSSDKGYYYVLLIAAVLIVVALAALNRGRLGRMLEAMGDSPLALETRGASSVVLKVIVFCISAAIASMAGALSASLNHFAVGDSFQPFESLTLVVLVVIITVGDPWYAILGAISNTIISGYISGSNVTNALTLLFGVSGIFAVYGARIGGAPVVVQRFLDRLGGRKPEPEAPVGGPPAVMPRRTPEDGAAREAALARGGLAVEGLSVTFGGVRAVNGVSLQAPMGLITGLIGPNGAGKTTMFNACSGLVRRPAAGRIHVHGNDVTRYSPPQRARRGLGRTFQRPEVFNSLTVRQAVCLGAEAPVAGGNPARQLFESRSSRRAIAAAADEAMSLTGTTRIANRQVGLLTIGQRRLVELAMVLAGSFDVLLLDEPSSGLDGLETEAFGQVLKTVVAQRGAGILLVEHDMSLVRDVCDRVYVLDFGSLLFEGTPEEMHKSEAVRAAYLGETVSAAGTEKTPVPQSRVAAGRTE